MWKASSIDIDSRASILLDKMNLDHTSWVMGTQVLRSIARSDDIEGPAPIALSMLHFCFQRCAPITGELAKSGPPYYKSHTGISVSSGMFSTQLLTAALAFETSPVSWSLSGVAPRTTSAFLNASTGMRSREASKIC
jgi:hypothetical protein